MGLVANSFRIYLILSLFGLNHEEEEDSKQKIIYCSNPMHKALKLVTNPNFIKIIVYTFSNLEFIIFCCGQIFQTLIEIRAEE